HKMRCRFLIPVIALAVVAGSPALAQPTTQSEENLALTVGTARVVTLAENPTTGFEWHVDTAESINLAAVQVTDLGHEQQSKELGAPGTHSWRIQGIADGKAQLVFDYARPWEHGAPADRHVVHIDIAPAQ
ncbi:MAG: protease inhibitor I42 family protein, partial [Methylovirgula sp.]